MEKVYNLSEETAYFKVLMNLYLEFNINLKEGERSCTFMSSNEPLNCTELLRYAVHQAECGENVYLVGFPRQLQVLHRPETLFFLERWPDFLDVDSLEHGLALAVVNRNQYDHHKLQETFTHIQTNFKSFLSISIQN